MSKQTTRTLFDSLQREFCPTLDSSLIAALLVEIESDIEGNTMTPTEEQIDSLRSTLSELSLQADESQQSEFSDVHQSQLDETISSWTTPDLAADNSGTFSRGSSGSSESSAHSFGSPLGFLQTALPDVPTSRLNHVLREAQKDDETDMWDIVARILTEESIREMEERGLEDEEDFNVDDIDWETVETKKKPMAKKKARPRPKKVALADIRQQHHVVHRKNGSVSEAAADPWIQVSSLSTQLASLLPPHPPSTFSSFFHSPEYATSYDALYAALTSLCKQPADDSHRHTTVLFNLLDVIMPEYEECDVEQRSRVMSDVQLAVAVTEGRGDDAMDIVALLRDLDSDSDLGLNHLPAPKADNAIRTQRPVHPPDIPPPPPLSKAKQKPPLPSSLRNKPSPYQWQAVPQRKIVARGPHPLAHHIPAYNRDVNGTKTHRGYGRHAADVDASAAFRRRMNEAMLKRNRALMDATRMWQKGNAKNRGGDVALYYAERARELEIVARHEMLNVARDMVHSRRTTNGNHDVVDLHGTTVAEAIVIVKEILNERGSTISPAKPMNIVTGRGAHSVGQVGVLKPAIRKALEEDGWIVGSWDAGLVVRQRRS